MKTLDEIINRQDYQNANKALVKRAGELAIIFCEKMRNLNIIFSPTSESRPKKGMSITVNNNTYSVRRLNWYYNGEICRSEYYFTRLVFDGYDYDYPSRYYFDTQANFDCDGDADNEASYKMYVAFLNDAKDIVTALDEIESSKVAEINNAIANSKDIVI